MYKQQRIDMVKAMEMIARTVNYENIFMSWLSLGVADGDIKPNTSDDELEYYIEDDKFAELMDTFLYIMSKAYKSGGLYVDNVLSNTEE